MGLIPLIYHATESPIRVHDQVVARTIPTCGSAGGALGDDFTVGPLIHFLELGGINRFHLLGLLLNGDPAIASLIPTIAHDVVGFVHMA